MRRRKAKKPNHVITSMRLSTRVVDEATKKARRLGISRTVYFDQILRRDLGMEAVDLDEPVNPFG